MGQVVLNGVVHDLDYEPSVQHGAKPMWRTPIEINGRMVHGVNINGYDYPPCDSDCVLYLPGLPGYGSTIWDRSNQGKHGTITGATWRRLPGGLRCLNHDGDDYVTCGNISQLDATTNFTLRAWLIITAWSATNYTHIISYVADDDNRFSFSLTNTDYKLWMGLYSGGVGDNKAINYTLSLNVPYRMVMTRDGTNLNFYLNGTYLDGVASTRTWTGWTGTLRLMTYSTTVGRTIGISGLQQINLRALSASEVKNDFNQESHLFRI